MGIQVKYPIHIQVDNAAGISSQQSTCVNTRLKGIYDLREGWVQELKDKKTIEAIKVNTKDNIADLLTKCHASGSHTTLLDLVTDLAKRIAREG